MTQCYNISVYFDVENTCASFSTCKDAVLTSQLSKVNKSDYVVLNSSRSAVEVKVSLPEDCRCSAVPDNPLTNSVGLADSKIAAVVLCVVCAILLIVIAVVIVHCLCYKKRRKPATDSDFQ